MTRKGRLEELAKDWDSLDEYIVANIKQFADPIDVAELEAQGGPLVYWETEALINLLIDAIQGTELTV